MMYAYHGTHLLRRVPNVASDDGWDVTDEDAPRYEGLTSVADPQQAHYVCRTLNELHRDLPLWRHAIDVRPLAQRLVVTPDADVTEFNGSDFAGKAVSLLGPDGGLSTRARVALRRTVTDLLSPYASPLVNARIEVDGLDVADIDMAVNAWLADAGPDEARSALDVYGDGDIEYSDGTGDSLHLPSVMEFYADSTLLDLVTVLRFGIAHHSGGHVSADITIDPDQLQEWLLWHTEQPDVAGTTR